MKLRVDPNIKLTPREMFAFRDATGGGNLLDSLKSLGDISKLDGDEAGNMEPEQLLALFTMCRRTDGTRVTAKEALDLDVSLVELMGADEEVANQEDESTPLVESSDGSTTSD